MAPQLELAHLVAPAHTVAQSCVTEPNGQQYCVEQASGGIALAGGAILLIYLIVLVVTIIAYVSIIRKAGYSGWWVLVGLVPIVNVVFFLIFAFATWPVVAEVRALRSASYGSGPYGRPPPGGPFVPVAVPPSAGGPPMAGGPPPAAGGRPPVPGSPVPGSALPGVGAQPEVAAPAQTGESAVIPSFGEVMRAGGVTPMTVTPAAAETVAETAPAQPSAGWFPSPEGPPGRLRYWDGANWTDQYH